MSRRRRIKEQNGKEKILVCNDTYVSFNEITPMWYKVVVVLHFPPFLDSDEMFAELEYSKEKGKGASPSSRCLEFDDDNHMVHPTSEYVVHKMSTRDSQDQDEDQDCIFCKTKTISCVFLKVLGCTCSDLLLDPLFDLDNIGGLLFVAPRPASRLLSKEGLLAQMKAWKEDTVNTPNLFREQRYV
ncbi:unnamed protein product [Acanthoscelides obtectus]|uniref:Uncharacterized protein n=1 Tax=Acanthoscelides obtectus TaxID=200917 RepID=A0A9P0KTA2_ACAOB|nr:unnamed protein product [Acanthoscelides obtectus]CAK1664408.1 hypothetical protein AOBTE_LOCUS24245 [Acanthoscelides obtectus]